MKAIKILIIALILFSSLPLEGFCNNAHSQDVDHHCALVCHAPCCHPTLPNNAFSFNLPPKSTLLLSSGSHPHEDPFLSTSERPPIFLS